MSAAVSAIIADAAAFAGTVQATDDAVFAAAETHRNALHQALTGPAFDAVRGRHAASFHGLPGGPSGPAVGSHPAGGAPRGLPAGGPSAALPSPGSLTRLPPEVRHNVYSALPAGDCAALARTARATADACSSQERRFAPAVAADTRYRQLLGSADDHARDFLTPALATACRAAERHFAGMATFFAPAPQPGDHDLGPRDRFAARLRDAFGIEWDGTDAVAGTIVSRAEDAVDTAAKQMNAAATLIDVAEQYRLRRNDLRDQA